MKKIRCSVSYHRAKVNLLNGFAGGVRDGIYGNATTFATPPISELDFQVLITDHYNKRVAYENGGSAQKGPYQAARTALMQALDQLSPYVDAVADGDENIILLSGFEPIKGFTSEKPKPEQVTGVTIERGAPGVLIAECDKQAVATYYGCIVTEKQPIPPDVTINSAGQIKLGSISEMKEYGIIDLTIGRRKEFINLTPGVIYYFVFYAVNAQGVGAMSDPKSMMCA